MTIPKWYSTQFEDQISGRFLHPDQVESLLRSYANQFKLYTIGTSENGKSIHALTLGTGQKKVLAWSQMHGNEATTTKAVFDLLKFLVEDHPFSSRVQKFLSNYTLCVVPMLNPDGALLYTRENANQVDLNRDAKNLSQSESRALRALFDEFQPDLCLNLHDQRSIYGLESGKPAIVSFLAPAADADRTLTPAREVAMRAIARMNAALQSHIPGQVGRYDDTYNENCVGDTFQSLGVPTILFEAGHYPCDYQREQTRACIFYAFLALFGLYDEETFAGEVTDYLNIPQNKKNYCDVLLINVDLSRPQGLVSIAIQYEEVLSEGRINFVPKVAEIGNLSDIYGHKTIDVGGSKILINSHENVFVNDKISMIVAKNDEKVTFFSHS